MADLSYDFATLKNAALHAAAKDALASGNSVGQVVNAALNYLARCHAWHWRTKYASLSTNNGDNSIDLPADFGELVHLAGAATPYDTKRFRPVPDWELPIIRQRATAIAANAVTATAVFYSVSGKAQATATALRLYQLELHPTPASTTSNCLALVYRAMPAVLSADTDVADIPTDFQDLLLQCVRAMARGREDAANAGGEWGLFEKMLENQKALNDRVPNPNLPRLSNVIDDYFDVGKVRVSWT